jgi:HPt (histidine-containing phosphotransfer) domain-containing protein
MTIQECYQRINGDYEEVLSRFYSEKLVDKFICMYLNDKSFNQLKEALKNQNAEEAFRAAHTLKGTCSNLGLPQFYQSAYAMTEELRNGIGENADELMKKVTEDHERTIQVLQQYVEDKS